MLTALKMNLITINHTENPRLRCNTEYYPIHICKNVWIETGVTIITGVTVGENSIIAAGVVITKDIPANVIAGGVPAL